MCGGLIIMTNRFLIHPANPLSSIRSRATWRWD